MTAEACSVHSFKIFSYSFRKSLVFVVVEKNVYIQKCGDARKYINEATKVAHLNLDEKVVHFKSASSIQCKYALISNIIRSVNQCKYALISDIIRLVNYTHIFFCFRCSTDATNQIMIRGSI